MKKSESDSESEEITECMKNEVRIKQLERLVIDLQDRVLALEKALTHAQHTNTDDGSRHQNDAGWFD
jgi:hypothetical protein